MRSGRGSAQVAAMLLVGLVALTGCSGGGSSDSQASSADDVVGGAGGAVAEPAPVPGEARGAAGADRADQAGRAAVTTRAVVKKGEISLTSKDIDGVRAEVADLLAAVGGTLDQEETANDAQGRAESSTLVLRVPVAKFAATKKALEKLGRLVGTDESAQDVTTEVIDVDERVQTLQNSLDRLQKFQAASKDVGDLIRFEDQITQRQSELQSLQAQQAYLRDQTSLSTLTLHVTTPEKYVPPPDALEDAGFLAGLKGGWNALVDTVVVLLTIIGAVLPFAVVVLVLGVPSLLVLRRLLRRRTTSPPAAPAEG